MFSPELEASNVAQAGVTAGRTTIVNVELFGPVHLSLLALIGVLAAGLAGACRKRWISRRIVASTFGWGLAGAGMATLTPDLWSPWPSYPAVYFFVVHGGIVAPALVLVYRRTVWLDSLGPWPVYVFAGLILAVALFRLLALPVPRPEKSEAAQSAG